MSSINKRLFGKLINVEIIILMTFYTLSACQQRVLPHSEDVKVVNIINKSNPIQVDIQDIVDSVQYVALETSDKCLLSDIERVVKEEELYFVHDSKGLFVFNQQGHFMNEIGHRGIAPNEYVYMNCFYIDSKKKNVCIVCNAQKRIMQYTYDGIFLSSLEISEKYANIQYAMACDDDQVLAYYPLPDGVFKNNIEYCMFKKKGNKLIANPLLEALNVTTNNSHFAISCNPMALFDRKYVFLSTFSNEIYTYKEEKVLPIYAIEYPKSCPDPTFLEEYKGWDFFELRHLMEERDIGLGITALEESSGYLFASISNKSTLIWDKDQAILLSRIYDRNLNLFSDLILPGGVSNEHIGSYSADFLCGIKDVVLNGENTHLRSIVNSLLDEDNPVIYKYCFKKNLVKLLSDKYKFLNKKDE